MFAYKIIKGSDQNTQPNTKEDKQYKKLPINCIRPNPFQPRKIFDEDEIQSLSQSIKENGLIQPITVRQVGEDNYELIAGERRFRACRLAGLEYIDAFIMEAEHIKSATLALIENVQRQDLHFFEEALAISKLIKDHNLTQEQISISLGKKQSTIANKLRILKLDDTAREKIILYKLTERHARALLKIESDALINIAIDNIYKNQLNVKKSEDYIESLIKGHLSLPKKARISKFICDNRIYVNSVKSVFKAIIQRGVKATFDVDEKDEQITMTIVISK